MALDQTEDLMAKRRSPSQGGKPEEIKITLPAELTSLLRMAADKRAFWEGGEPDLSKYVLNILEKHREEIELEAGAEMRT